MRSLKKSKKIKVLITVVFVLIAAHCLSFATFAEDGEALSMPEGFENIRDSLPDEALDSLPEGIFSSDAAEQGEALEEMTSPQYALSLLRDLIGVEIGTAAKLFIAVVGLLILSSALNAMRISLTSRSLGTAMRFCMTGAVMAALIGVQFSQLESVALYFERINSLMRAMIPVGSAVLAMGGNVSTAATSSATLSVFLGVCETLCAETVIPVVCACTALALCNTLSADIGLNGFASAIRKTYTFILGTVMTLLVATLSSQTTLSAAADSTGAKAAKLVSSTAIPIVGGTVGETLRTVASGVSYLKTVVGIGGIVFIVLLVLPVLISLILTRVVFLLTGGVADMLGCETEGKLLSELGSVWGTIIAVVAMCAVMFILALVIFVRVAVAAA